MKIQRHFLSLCFSVSLFAFSGCGESLPPAVVENVVPVSGTVKFDGKPQAGIQVSFAPFGQNLNSRGGTAVTDAEGKFQLKNYMNADGIPAGQYVATFSWMDTGGAAANPNQPPIPGITAKEKIPPMWSDKNKKGRHNSITIPDAGKTDLAYDIPAK